MPQYLSEVWAEVEAAAKAAGALRLGASSIDDARVSEFASWLAEGHHAEMAYLERSLEVRRAPAIRYPWARSVLVITVPYSPHRPPPSGTVASRVARYAQGDDYHVVLDSMLQDLEKMIRRTSPETLTRRYVDTGPLSDRTYGAQAGLGWVGKNGMLIDPEYGSYFFIGTLLTSLENDIAEPEVSDRCGQCTRCVDACPTAAILPDRTVASGRCISYLTIEHRGAVDDELAEHFHGNLFGCDICQEVCPWNEVAPPGHPAFDSRPRYSATPVTDLLRFSQGDFSAFFRGSAIKRAKHAGMVRNAALISEDLPQESLQALASDPDEGVRAAAAWRLSWL